MAAAASSISMAGAQDAATLAKLDRISLMTNDFDAILPEIWDRSKEVAPKELDIMDLPDAVETVPTSTIWRCATSISS